MEWLFLFEEPSSARDPALRRRMIVHLIVYVYVGSSGTSEAYPILIWFSNASDEDFSRSSLGGATFTSYVTVLSVNHEYELSNLKISER